MRIRVFLVDDHKIVLEGVAALLVNEKDIQVVGQAQDGITALQMLPRLQPDVLILDIQMPDLDGFAIAQQVHLQHPNIRIIILSIHNTVAYAAEALRKGAKAYIFKDSGSDYLVQAIHLVMQNQIFLNPPLTVEMVNEFRHKTRTGELELIDTLTPSERIVFHMILNGLSSREIANKLSNSVRTVDTHRANILRKLMVSNTFEMIRYAMEHGLIKSEKPAKDQ